VHLMTAYGSEELAVQAMKSGADDYMARADADRELEMRIRAGPAAADLGSGKRGLGSKWRKVRRENIIGAAPAMKEILGWCNKWRRRGHGVDPRGERTGKELIAKAISHAQSTAKTLW